MSGTLRVASWNLHGFVGPDRRCDPERAFGILAELGADILALQEVDGRVHLGRRAGAFERLREVLGGHVVEARMTGEGERAYGHLLWSRWPIEGGRVLRLPGGRIEPRGVAAGTVETPLGALSVLACHFGLVPADRRRQAAWLAEILRETAGPRLALGDFNDWRLAGGSVHRALLPVLPDWLALPSWPARRPFVRMDRLYAGGGAAIREGHTAAAGAAASDHLPLVAEIALPPLSPSPAAG